LFYRIIKELSGVLVHLPFMSVSLTHPPFISLYYLSPFPFLCLSSLINIFLFLILYSYLCVSSSLYLTLYSYLTLSSYLYKISLPIHTIHSFSFSNPSVIIIPLSFFLPLDSYQSLSLSNPLFSSIPPLSPFHLRRGGGGGEARDTSAHYYETGSIDLNPGIERLDSETLTLISLQIKMYIWNNLGYGRVLLMKKTRGKKISHTCTLRLRF
jgi:hypothetical protein